MDRGPTHTPPSPLQDGRLKAIVQGSAAASETVAWTPGVGVDRQGRGQHTAAHQPCACAGCSNLQVFLSPVIEYAMGHYSSTQRYVSRCYRV